jgi:hypothetical protein
MSPRDYPDPVAVSQARKAGRRIAKLTRVRKHGRDLDCPTLMFTCPGGAGRGNSRSDFINKENVPPFEGETAWFELETVKAIPWPYLRAVRQLPDPPAEG